MTREARTACPACGRTAFIAVAAGYRCEGCGALLALPGSQDPAPGGQGSEGVAVEDPTWVEVDGRRNGPVGGARSPSEEPSAFREGLSKGFEAGKIFVFGMIVLASLVTVFVTSSLT